MNPDPGPGLSRDVLLDLQLRIARRADELARIRETKIPCDLQCWLRAETEILCGEVPDRLANATSALR